MCIGNREGGDDGIGPSIADKLDIDFPHGMVLDCGTTPENYTTIVKRQKPTTLILIDAVDMELPAGSVRIIPKEKLGNTAISTHRIPLLILINYLEKEVRHILFIGIQPETLSGKISISVQKSADKLVNLLKANKIHQIPILQ
jgi:hydrogenase 3 maturation protease